MRRLLKNVEYGSSETIAILLLLQMHQIVTSETNIERL
jgi:hypothetical protein